MPLLNWLNKDDAVKAGDKVAYRLLEAVPEQSYGDKNTENMLIQGDNLEALKALLPYYAGKVKCIYIDPPFNTQQAFDNYDDNLEHSTWLSVMYPRLELLRELLSEEGSFFVHIDDAELAYLIVIMDEVFGRKNRINISTFKQGAATGHKAINPGMVKTTNFIVCYTKNKSHWKPNRVFTSRNRDSRYSQFISNFESPYHEWKTITLTKSFSDYYGKPIKELKKEFGDGYENKLNTFVLKHADRVIRTARPDYQAVGEDVRKAIDESNESQSEIILHKREKHSDMYFKSGERWLFYKDKLKEVDGKMVSGEPLTTLWDDILSNNLHNEGGVKFPKSKKPEFLIKRIFELSTKPSDLILDSFLGSGTTAAVAHKMGRRYIGIEMGEHATTHCVLRLQKVIDGEQGGISKAVNWQGGGGFRFYRLGQNIFDEQGQICRDIHFNTLAAHIWYLESKTPLLNKADSPLLGIHNGVAYYLLYNGILGDKRPHGGNVLTSKVLAALPPFDGHKVIYGETTRMGTSRLEEHHITFKQTPYDIKVR